MSAIAYDLTSDVSDLSLKHFFVSSGNVNIIKAIEYSFVHDLGTRKIFNLAFGDYDMLNGTIDDTAESNNGDAYKVFNTVLNTIPEFFTHFPNDIIMVTGSDSRIEYLEKCKVDCKKKCIEVENCKNKDRRINLYMKHVTRNYNEFTQNFVFFGGFKNGNNLQIVPYVTDNKYDAVFVIRNNK